MFTIYIHALEVLGIKPNGARVKDIVEMGCQWTSQTITGALRSLEKDGYVTSYKIGRTKYYQMTEKAGEYTGRISKLYDQSRIMDDIADYVRGR